MRASGYSIMGIKRIWTDVCQGKPDQGNSGSIPLYNSLGLSNGPQAVPRIRPALAPYPPSPYPQ